jgi:multidrug efflux pump subunit AcrB
MAPLAAPRNRGDALPGMMLAYRAQFEKELPANYAVAVGGAVDETWKSELSVAAVVPLMLLLMVTILMVQLQCFQRLFLVLSGAPLGLIGVVTALVLSSQPLGFIATLGVIALVGMIVRNSVILIDQIESELSKGLDGWNVIIVATMHRTRPILLTAAAAILGMVPIASNVFWHQWLSPSWPGGCQPCGRLFSFPRALRHAVSHQAADSTNDQSGCGRKSIARSLGTYVTS